MKLIFATQNKHKVKEIQSQIMTGIEVLSLIDMNYLEELEETQETLEGNALQKARFVAKKFKTNCFADDTGLEIESLNGEPGVYSARYAGIQKSFDDNMNLVLQKLDNQENRAAQFRTVIALIIKGKEYLFEGTCKGQITMEKFGIEGFGYDPIFKPYGYENTFAQMDLETKNAISHRGKAVSKLIDFLNTQSF